MKQSFRLVATFGWIISLLMLPFESKAEVRIGANRLLEVNGRPLFVVGAYALPKGMNFEEGKAMGFNLVHVSSDPKHWQELEKAGLYGWYSFGSSLDLSGETLDSKKSAITAMTRRFADHPSLLFWESMDEPAWSHENPARARALPEGLIEGYTFLKSLDPNHPVYLNHAPRNTVTTLRAYNPACDIVCVDIYPIIPPGLRPMYAITPEGHHGDLPNQSPSCVGEYVDKMAKVAEEDQTVFIVLQGFAWETLRDQDQNPAMVLYPTYQESRFMAYHAITHRVKGILYWGLHTVAKEHPFISDLSKVLREIQQLSPLIIGTDWIDTPFIRYHERGSTIAAGIELLCKQTETQSTMIAVNTGIHPAAADFLSLPPEFTKAGTIEVVGENRSVTVSNDAFFDEFQGLDVHIYIVNKQ